MAEKNQKVKMESIDAFFDDYDNKANYLVELYKTDRRDEARILCACYIDGLTSALCWPDERSNYNYVNILKEHGGNEIFAYVHPIMLDNALNKLSERKKWKTILQTISDKLQVADRRFPEEHEILELFAPYLNATELELVRKEIWRGTYAAIIYSQFRVSAVHRFGPPNGTTFDLTTFQGKPVPAIDFSMVHGCLKRIIGVARDISKNSGKWFGHDFE
jgi:hypothetical protein